MISRVQKTVLVLVMVLFMAFSNTGSASAGALLADLENALMCKCDDKCGKVLENCTCSTSDKTRKKFSKMLESGLTVEQIIKQQVEEHGETMLSAPTKKRVQSYSLDNSIWSDSGWRTRITQASQRLDWEKNAR